MKKLVYFILCLAPISGASAISSSGGLLGNHVAQIPGQTISMDKAGCQSNVNDCLGGCQNALKACTNYCNTIKNVKPGY